MSEGAVDLANAGATADFGRSLANVTRVGDVIALSGPLGAGKTSLVRGLLAGLDFAGDVPSPSYPLVIAYEPPEVRLPLWHVDLYRIDQPAEIAELGLDDALAAAALAIEWPERAGKGRWGTALRLAIEPAGAGRRLTWRAPAAWDGRWPPRR